MIFGNDAIREMKNSFLQFNPLEYNRKEIRLISMHPIPIYSSFISYENMKKYQEDANKEFDIRNRISNCVNPKVKSLLNIVIDMGLLVIYSAHKDFECWNKQNQNNNSMNNSLAWLKYPINQIAILQYFEEVRKDIIKKYYLDTNSNSNFNYLKYCKNENKISEFNNAENNPSSYLSYKTTDKEDSYNIVEKAFKEIWPYSFDALEDLRWRMPKILESGIGSAYQNTKTMKDSIEKIEKE